MKIDKILGIDVSKDTLKCHLYLQDQQLDSIPNSVQGFKQLSKWLEKQCKTGLHKLLVVVEHTGIYTYGLEQYLYQQSIAYVKRPPLDIKGSPGKYSWVNKEGVTPMKAIGATLLELEQLINYRNKLVADRTSYRARIKELASQMGDKVNSKITTSNNYIMDVLDQEIKEIEWAIKH